MVWYSHLLQNFPQFIVIHTVEGFGVVNKAEIVLTFSSPKKKKSTSFKGLKNTQSIRMFWSAFASQWLTKLGLTCLGLHFNPFSKNKNKTHTYHSHMCLPLHP